MLTQYISRFIKLPSIIGSHPRRSFWALPTLLVAALSVGFGAIIWQMSEPDNGISSFQARFEAIKDVEVRWGAELLSLQLGIARNYDAVTNDARIVELGVRDLIMLAADNASMMSLSPALQDYHDAIERKIWLSEQVKASYAMLRNSVSVLPDAIDETRHSSGSSPQNDRQNGGVSGRVAGLITATVSFVVSPTKLLEDRVRQSISETDALIPVVPPPMAETLQRLMAQVGVVLKERQRGSRLMLEVTSVPSEVSTSAIRAELQALHLERTDRRRWLRDLALASGLLLVSASVLLFMSLRRRFAELKEDNRLLRQVNANAEEQLMQSARLSALGQMAAGITHEINTPLAYVKAVFEVLSERVTDRWEMTMPSDVDASSPQEIEEHRIELQSLLKDGLHGLNEMATLVHNMQNFARNDKGDVQEFRIEEAIESALQIAAPRLGKEIEVRREIETIPSVVGSPAQIRQAVVNLIVNAADAMADGSHPPVLTVRAKLVSSDIVGIEIGDNGPGIAEKDLGNIFNPFFTTKAVGEGTGMGLSITYRIIENHGGTITVNSKIGAGTIFTISLPRHDTYAHPGNRSERTIVGGSDHDDS
ncbi:two-component system NtrC family sensor kinase [Agrobacterium larrymoorei]|uniref:histidine kinase n=1 Tax=Agrobacterium larrymoorei TaxID=160699 RepID=A0AAJ2ESQ7_9HYPH|nr:ATP-binding protein [Agrobacterium larrymoorei]MDR6101738.1 two-component system NtrC family sensor kinase [Agrobacterium larrymoorei]